MLLVVVSCLFVVVACGCCLSSGVGYWLLCIVVVRGGVSLCVVLCVVIVRCLVCVVIVLCSVLLFVVCSWLSVRFVCGLFCLLCVGVC